MATVYGVVLVILLVLWFMCCIGTAIALADDGGVKEDFQVASGIAVGVLLAIIVWPLVIPAAIVVALVYGGWQLLRILTGRLKIT